MDNISSDLRTGFIEVCSLQDRIFVAFTDSMLANNRSVLQFVTEMGMLSRFC